MSFSLATVNLKKIISFMWKFKLSNKNTYTTCTSGVGVSGATQFTVTINFSVASIWVAEFYENKIMTLTSKT